MIFIVKERDKIVRSVWKHTANINVSSANGINILVPYNWMNSVNTLTRKTKAIPSQAKSQLLEGVETTGGRMVFLNNQHERPATLFNLFLGTTKWIN